MKTPEKRRTRRQTNLVSNKRKIAFKKLSPQLQLFSGKREVMKLNNNAIIVVSIFAFTSVFTACNQTATVNTLPVNAVNKANAASETKTNSSAAKERRSNTKILQAGSNPIRSAIVG